jgi:hypothetical protein
MLGLKVQAQHTEMELQMSHQRPRSAALAVLAVALPAVILTSACAYTPSSAPEQVSATNPTVTYVYRGDEELIGANQKAQVFCDPYQGTPRAISVLPTSDGGKSAVFECLKTPPAVVVLAPASSYLSVSYQTDQELLNASRNARLYCLNSGLRGVTTSIRPNPIGANTVTFQCSAS